MPRQTYPENAHGQLKLEGIEKEKPDGKAEKHETRPNALLPADGACFSLPPPSPLALEILERGLLSLSTLRVLTKLSIRNTDIAIAARFA